MVIDTVKAVLANLWPVLWKVAEAVRPILASLARLFVQVVLMEHSN